jgi:Xaa-Pro aminopeptidase
MITDLDRLMADRGLSTLVVQGSDGLTSVSAAWNYMTRGQKMTGYVVKKVGEPPRVLFHPMERLQAEASGCVPVSMGTWDMKSISQSTPTRLAAGVELWRQIIGTMDISGRVGWYGAVEASTLLPFIAALNAAVPSVQIVGEYENSVIDVARRTKDAHEIAALREAGIKTCNVVRQVEQLLRSCREKSGEVLNPATNSKLTIGAVKQLIRRASDDLGLDVGDPIFAQGRDAGIPHAHGEDDHVLKVGQPIVFDIYPKHRKSGYYHDMTRTFVPGQATDATRKIYADVKVAFDRVIADLKLGERTKKYQDLTCDIFESQGHKTVATHYPLEEGYVHSLGHGLGLEVHEPLAFSSFVDRGDQLERGNVFTVEPGLYYPEREIGVRLEDTYWCTPDGTFESLTPYPMDLEIPLAK